MKGRSDLQQQLLMASLLQNLIRRFQNLPRRSKISIVAAYSATPKPSHDKVTESFAVGKTTQKIELSHDYKSN